MDTDINDLKIAISILDLVLSAFNIIVVCLLGFVVGRVQISLYRGMNELAGYIRLNPEYSGMVVDIVIENRGYADQSFNLIKTDKNEILYKGFLKMKPKSMEILTLGEYDQFLPVLKKAKEIDLLNGLRKNRKTEEPYRYKIITEEKLNAFLVKCEKKAKNR